MDEKYAYFRMTLKEKRSSNSTAGKGNEQEWKRNRWNYSKGEKYDDSF